MAVALLAMLAQMERIYMLERAAGARAAKEAHGLPTRRLAKLTATTRAGAAQRTRCGGGTSPRPTVRSPNRSPQNSASAAPGGTERYASTARAPATKADE
ncbi:hypothetical protein [Streptomyces mirabilis]|uniref:hypothetical protein n=1 Tax=Streptomyces mirabilis TaxID=68239 RepID=UPI0036C2EAA5